MELRLPYPVSSNAVWSRTRGGVRKSDEYSAWLTEAGWAIRQQKPVKIIGRYEMHIEAVRPDKRRRDIDNIIGSVSDALQAFGVIENDYLCECVSAKWVDGEGGCLVTITEAA
jgi:crossover junction endodeoxyribonuclease RusA